MVDGLFTGPGVVGVQWYGVDGYGMTILEGGEGRLKSAAGEVIRCGASLVGLRDECRTFPLALLFPKGEGVG